MIRVGQEEEPVILLTDAMLDEWLADYDDEEIEAVVDLWQKYAGAQFENLIVAEVDAGA